MNHYFKNFPIAAIPTPSFVVDEVKLESNLRILSDVQERSGAKVLLALKAFSMYYFGDTISKYLSGVCASGLHEAQLGRDFFKGEVHTFSAAYPPQDIEKVLALSDHVIFNSFNQWQRYQGQCQSAKKGRPHLAFGLRINPEQPEGEYPIYDPSTKGSRLGIVKSEFKDRDLTGITGLHFHNLCEQDIEPLKRTLAKIEENFADALTQVEWVNFGGGHHITRADYQREELIQLIRAFRKKWQVDVFIEPGEAIALGTGFYVTEVLDITYNAMNIAIVDGSCSAHLPDVLEMPYRPEVINAGEAGEKAHTYRIGGLTCLAGDIMGDYSFDAPLTIGQRIIFNDMSHYTMVKTNTFNGVKLPSIISYNSKTGSINVVKEFGYQDFRMRLS